MEKDWLGIQYMGWVSKKRERRNKQLAIALGMEIAKFAQCTCIVVEPRVTVGLYAICKTCRAVRIKNVVDSFGNRHRWWVNELKRRGYEDKEIYLKIKDFICLKKKKAEVDLKSTAQQLKLQYAFQEKRWMP